MEVSPWASWYVESPKASHLLALIDWSDCSALPVPEMSILWFAPQRLVVSEPLSSWKV